MLQEVEKTTNLLSEIMKIIDDIQDNLNKINDSN